MLSVNEKDNKYRKSVYKKTNIYRDYINCNTPNKILQCSLENIVVGAFRYKNNLAHSLSSEVLKNYERIDKKQEIPIEIDIAIKLFRKYYGKKLSLNEEVSNKNIVNNMYASVYLNEIKSEQTLRFLSNAKSVEDIVLLGKLDCVFDRSKKDPQISHILDIISNDIVNSSNEEIIAKIKSEIYYQDKLNKIKTTLHEIKVNIDEYRSLIQNRSDIYRKYHNKKTSLQKKIYNANQLEKSLKLLREDECLQREPSLIKEITDYQRIASQIIENTEKSIETEKNILLSNALIIENEILKNHEGNKLKKIMHLLNPFYQKKVEKYKKSILEDKRKINYYLILERIFHNRETNSEMNVLLDSIHTLDKETVWLKRSKRSIKKYTGMAIAASIITLAAYNVYNVTNMADYISSPQNFLISSTQK